MVGSIEIDVHTKKVIHINSCMKCWGDDIELGDCGYSSFNVAHGRCKSCGHKMTWSNLSWNVSKEWIAKKWNEENDPDILINIHQHEIDRLKKEIRRLKKRKPI